MTIHSDWVDTYFILLAEHVILHGLNQTHAWFCVTDPVVDVYSSSLLPFVHANQYFLALLFVKTHQHATDVIKVK